jgi:hypothetical protein
MNGTPALSIRTVTHDTHNDMTKGEPPAGLKIPAGAAAMRAIPAALGRNYAVAET